MVLAVCDQDGPAPRILWPTKCGGVQPIACADRGLEIECIAPFAGPSGVTRAAAVDAITRVVAIWNVRAYKRGGWSFVSSRMLCFGYEWPHGVVPRPTSVSEFVVCCAHPGEAMTCLVSVTYLLAAFVVIKSSPEPTGRRISIAVVPILLNYKVVINLSAAEDVCNAPKHEYEHLTYRAGGWINRHLYQLQENHCSNDSGVNVCELENRRQNTNKKTTEILHKIAKCVWGMSNARSRFCDQNSQFSLKLFIMMWCNNETIDWLSCTHPAAEGRQCHLFSPAEFLLRVSILKNSPQGCVSFLKRKAKTSTHQHTERITTRGEIHTTIHDTLITN